MALSRWVVIFVTAGRSVTPRRLVVTAIASLKDSDGDSLYSRKHPAKVILACDKVLCPKTART